MTTVYVLAGIAVLAGLIWLGARTLRAKFRAAAEEMSSLLLEGVDATAQISATEKRRMSRGQFEYFVTYKFRTRDGTEHSKERRVPATHFDEFSTGQSVDIVYLPRDPSVSATRDMVDQVRGSTQSARRLT